MVVTSSGACSFCVRSCGAMSKLNTTHDTWHLACLPRSCMHREHNCHADRRSVPVPRSMQVGVVTTDAVA